ncbi:MAG: aspartate-semialdehyde dehydrogenase [Planctomycetota bacterium]
MDTGLTGDGPVVAVAGATGAVGVEFLRLFDERPMPIGELRLLASERSAGTEMICRGAAHTVRVLDDDSFTGVDLALFSAGGSISKRFAPIAVDGGALVIDNSSAFRMDPAVPLIVPEVNASAMGRYGVGEGSQGGIIANPNCSTIILIVPVTPIHRAFGVERMVVSTYQAVSGAGAAAMDELIDQTKAFHAGEDVAPRIFGEPCAHNVFSHDSAVDPETGRNVEEQKMVDETRKIWGDESIRVTATCVRVPVLRAHTESINLTLQEPATEDQVRELLMSAPGVEVVDNRGANDFPTPLKASDRDPVLVGRIRLDESQRFEGSGASRRGVGFDLLVSGDQIRKGAALNAVQIAELAIAHVAA